MKIFDIGKHTTFFDDKVFIQKMNKFFEKKIMRFMANYLEDDELYYEIVLSKGRGILTKKAERMIILIGNNMIRRKDNMYKNDDDRNDCLQTGLLHMFQKWMNFNEKKYKLALPFFSEVFKRGMATGYNELTNKKANQEKIIVVSLDSCNDGEGYHNY